MGGSTLPYVAGRIQPHQSLAFTTSRVTYPRPSRCHVPPAHPRGGGMICTAAVEAHPKTDCGEELLCPGCVVSYQCGRFLGQIITSGSISHECSASDFETVPLSIFFNPENNHREK